MLGISAASAALLGGHALRRALAGGTSRAAAPAPLSLDAPIESEPEPSVDGTSKAAGSEVRSMPTFQPTPLPARDSLAAGSARPAVAPSAAASETPPEPPSAALVAATLRSTPVIMFSTNWCSVCTRAREYFRANGIRYEERDIDSDQKARTELQKRAGKTSVPAFIVDGTFLGPGFGEASMTSALVASVERRLGVRGLRIVKQEH